MQKWCISLITRAFINEDMGYKQYSAYGSKILATLSQRLTARYGKGYTYTAVTRMMKVARFYSDEEMFATLSQTLTWSHFLELVTIEDNNKRLFYQQMGMLPMLRKKLRIAKDL